MSDIVIHQFDTEDAAREFFAGIINSSELHGAFFNAAGGLYRTKADEVTEIDGEAKFCVIVSGTDVIAD